MLFVSALVFVAALAFLVYHYRAKIEAFAPGWKSYIWHGLVVATGFVGEITVKVFEYLNTVDFTRVGVSIETAAVIAMCVGAVGVAISVVTKRVTAAA